MRAAVLESIPGELVIDEIQPGSVGSREVLVRTVRLLSQLTHQVALVQYPSVVGRSADCRIPAVATPPPDTF